MLRQGDYLRATVDLVENYIHGVKVELFTKRLDQTGNGALVDAGTIIALPSAGRQTQEWGPETGTGVGQLVRYRFSIYVPTPPASPNAWALFRMLTPIWFDALWVPTF